MLLEVLLYWTPWNSSYLWGNAFVFSLSEKERHSLQCRITQKSSVEVLCCWTPLKGAESSTHCCGFFSVTSDKDFFFLWQAVPAPPGAMQAHETRCLQLQVKKKDSGVSILDNLVADSKMANNAEQLIAELYPHPTRHQPLDQWFLSNWFQQCPTFMGSSTCQVTVHNHPTVSTEGLESLIYVCNNYRCGGIKVSSQYLKE